MPRARLSRRYLWSIAPVCFIVGVLLWGCVPQEARQPPQPLADVNKRLAALEECVVRSQRVVTAAADTGVSTGTLAPMNSSIADAQDALDEAKKLAQQHKQPEAAERAAQGLEECDKIEAMVTKARQDTAERKVRAQLATEVEARLAQTVVCVDGARQAVRSASAARAKPAEFATAKRALDSAEAALQQARELLGQNDLNGTLGRLDMAQAACQTAQAASPPAKPRRNR